MSRLLLLLLTLGLASCTSTDINRYAGNQPVFDPIRFFNGPIKAEGLVLDRSYRLQRYFSAHIDAQWNAEQGMLKETFVWNDGQRQTRNWLFKPAGKNMWLGTAGDVSGQAQMRFSGNAIHMRYPLQIVANGRSLTVTMDDWLYQVSDRVMINKTRISKFGFRLGEVILTLRKE